MSIKKPAIVFVSAYLTVCAILIFNSGIFPASASLDASRGGRSERQNIENRILTLAAEVHPVRELPFVMGQLKSAALSNGVNLPAPGLPEIAPLPDTPVSTSQITAANAEEKTFTLGSVLPAENNNPYKLELTLTTKGAAVLSARLRDYDNRDRKNPQPLELLSSVEKANTLADKKLLLPDWAKAFPLDRLNWQSSGITQNSNGAQTINFYATILKDNSELVKLTKTYTLKPEDYLLNCDITLANLSNSEIKTSLDMLGPVGISRENERVDTRTITTGFLSPQGSVEVTKINIKKLAKDFGGKAPLFHKNADYKFLWTSISNKYFTAIIRPLPHDQNNLSAEWIAEKSAIYYNPDGIINSNDENTGVALQTETVALAPRAEHTCSFQVYIGPKDRNLFNSVPLYKSLGFIKVIDFQACCGDTFSSLSFLILAAMNRLYQYIPNYGIVIIIFVFVVRLLLHPVTKKSQVSMMKMSKLAPKAEEIKKKYGDNKAELNKQMMGLYKEHGASPVLGCLPMLLQMPIWIALYSAIYAGIEFRGAKFLPFWITDLSSVDALFYFPAAAEKIPFIGSFIGTSFNLLPILLGAAMFVQQKFMPSSASATNPQAAQQQKMMMWMMPIMMLLFLYRAPSGLNLYIMSSTVAGLVEQYVIRKHIQEKEAAQEAGLVPTTSKMGGKLKKKKPKPPIKFS
jgi:YidC/Oxa1 family membrane protein insertase